jgi:hypothetical protein
MCFYLLLCTNCCVCRCGGIVSVLLNQTTFSSASHGPWVPNVSPSTSICALVNIFQLVQRLFCVSLSWQLQVCSQTESKCELWFMLQPSALVRSLHISLQISKLVTYCHRFFSLGALQTVSRSLSQLVLECLSTTWTAIQSMLSKDTRYAAHPDAYFVSTYMQATPSGSAFLACSCRMQCTVYPSPTMAPGLHLVGLTRASSSGAPVAKGCSSLLTHRLFRR